MAINTVDDVVAGLAAKQSLRFFKTLTAPKAAGAFQSSWLAVGIPGAGSAAPAYTAGSGYNCDKSTNGAMALTNGSVALSIARIAASSSRIGTLVLADRLWSCSGMGFGASTYAVTTPGNLPTRITDNGVGVEAYVEQFAAAGAASGTLTLNYLNAATGASKSGVIGAVVSAPVIGQLQPIPWQVGDTGIRQVTSAVNSATWTSGSFGITLVKRLAVLPIGIANTGVIADWAASALQNVPNDACLFWFYIADATTAPVIIGSVDLIDK